MGLGWGLILKFDRFGYHDRWDVLGIKGEQPSGFNRPNPIRGGVVCLLSGQTAKWKAFAQSHFYPLPLPRTPHPCFERLGSVTLHFIVRYVLNKNTVSIHNTINQITDWGDLMEHYSRLLTTVHVYICYVNMNLFYFIY